MLKISVHIKICVVWHHQYSDCQKKKWEKNTSTPQTYWMFFKYNFITACNCPCVFLSTKSETEKKRKILKKYRYWELWNCKCLFSGYLFVCHNTILVPPTPIWVFISCLHVLQLPLLLSARTPLLDQSGRGQTQCGLHATNLISIDFSGSCQTINLLTILSYSTDMPAMNGQLHLIPSPFYLRIT